MRLPSGSTDRKIFFVAVDVTDLKTRETGLTGFTVYRSRDGGTATLYTTPTVAELSAANMPGVYSLQIDEDTTIGATHDTEEYCVHITQASMAPVTRVLELYRPETTEGNTLVVDASGIGDADVRQWLGTAAATPTVAGVPEVDVTHVAGTVQTAGDIIGDTNDIQARLPAALVSGRIDASVGAMASGVVTAAAVATGAVDADALAADAVAEIADGVWDEVITSGHSTDNTAGLTAARLYHATQYLDAAVSTRLPTANITLTAGKVTVGTLDTGSISSTTFSAGAIDSAAIAANAIGASEVDADVIADIWQGTTLTESYAADGSAATPAQLLYQIWSALSEFAVSGVTITTKKLDGTTTAMTFTMDDETSPTSRTRAS